MAFFCQDMMKKGVVLIISVLFFFAVLPAQAREDYFVPVSGEVVISSPGVERAITTSEGGLNVLAADGSLLPSFPLFIDNQTIVSSPLLSDIIGGLEKEIVVITRDAQNTYALQAYAADKTLLASSNLPQEVYYDPVELKVAGQAKKDVVVVTTGGEVRGYHLAGGVFTSYTILSAGATAGVTFDVTGQEMVVNFPETKKISIYKKSGGSWALSKNITVTSAWLYPAVYGSTTTLYGVTRDSQLNAVDKNTATALAGFPVSLSGVPLSSPVVGEADESNPGAELVVSLSTGKAVAYSLAGATVTSKKTSFVTNAVAAVDSDQKGVWSSVGDYASFVYRQAKTVAVSLLGAIRYTIIGVVNQPELALSAAGGPVASGETVDFGVVTSTVGVEAEFTIENNGWSDLVLSGTPLVAISGSNASEFTLTAAPAASVSGGDITIFKIKYTPVNPGASTAILSITSNDPVSGVFTVTVAGQYDNTPLAVTDLVNDFSLNESAGANVFKNNVSSFGEATCSGTTCPTAGVTGKIGTAVDFDGTKSLLITGSNSLDPSTPTSSLTVEAWLKPGVPLVGQNLMVAVGRHFDYQLAVTRWGGAIFSNTTNIGGAGFEVPGAVSTGQWTHLVMTYDGQSIKGYVNGVLKGSKPQTGTLRVIGTLTAIGSASAQQLFYVGSIDEVKIYNRALTDTEVVAHFNR